MKVCNMNCAYCQYGRTRGVMRYRAQGTGWPSPQSIAVAVTRRLTRAASTNELIDRIIVAGHGEPTLHPDFEGVTTNLRDIRDRIAPTIPMAILSNSTTAGWPDVRRGLMVYDERHMKLDAGDPITYARITRSKPPVIQNVEPLRSLRSIMVQSMFVTDDSHQIDNSTEGAVAEWVGALESIQAAAVYIYTLDRAFALDSLKSVARRRLREIADRVRAIGIPATVIA
jgi:wyosine [tRNA(Phe)-imidazoG37] synthetase (radical SAM superfamily)